MKDHSFAAPGDSPALAEFLGRESLLGAWLRRAVPFCALLLTVVAIAAAAFVGYSTDHRATTTVAAHGSTSHYASGSAGSGGSAGSDSDSAIAAFDPEIQRGIERALKYADDRSGVLGLVVRDRLTGAVWSNDQADTPVWAASTIKLAMTVDLLTRDDEDEIQLSDDDRELIHQMLYISDNDATSTLWDRYGGEDFATRFPDYGLTSATFVDDHPHRWGYMKVTAEDLQRVMRYVLEELPDDQRDWVVNEMRTVDSNQQWGVWGAGSKQQPGNKNGWTTWQGYWVLNSVGFAGDDARYVVSMTSELRDGGTFEEGTQAESVIAALLFGADPPQPPSGV